MSDDDPNSEPLPDDIQTSLATQVELDTLAIERAKALGRPVIVASFASSGKATVYDLQGLSLDELRPVKVADNVRVTPSPPERRDDVTPR
jgi:hypothetical protein